jgi:hypothetical protein
MSNARARGLKEVGLVVCTKCTLIFLFVFSYIEIYYKDFSKHGGLATIESKILPQTIITKKETLLMIRYERTKVFGL